MYSGLLNAYEYIRVCVSGDMGSTATQSGRRMYLCVWMRVNVYVCVRKGESIGVLVCIRDCIRLSAYYV